MTIIQSIVLGIIQGLTEFIPVSSTAHLLLAQHFLNWQIPEAFKFDVLVQLGTLLALIIYFWHDLYCIVLAVLQGLWKRQPFADPQARLGWYLVLATIPASIVGLALKNVVEALFANPGVEAVIRLLISAVVLFIAERFGRKSRTLGSLGWLDALWIGISQVLSVFPGASRSGSTIFGGMMREFDRPSAARFAFLLSVPTMLGAGLVEGIGLLKVPNLSQILPDFAIGFLAAAVIGYLSIRWLLSYLNHHSLYVFSAYCAVIGLVVLGTLIL